MFESEIKVRNQTNKSSPMYEDKRTYTVNEIQDILKIGRSSAYSLIKKEVFKSVRIGGIIRISKQSFDKWLDNNQ